MIDGRRFTVNRDIFLLWHPNSIVLLTQISAYLFLPNNSLRPISTPESFNRYGTVSYVFFCSQNIFLVHVKKYFLRTKEKSSLRLLTFFSYHIFECTGAGRCFGELSVVSKNSTRNATIVADDPIILVCVTKELYSSFVCDSFAAEIVQRSSFIAMHPLFRGWPTAYRNLLSENLQYRKLKFGEHMVRQGDQLNAVCFIVDGHVKLTVNPIEHNESFSSLLANSKKRITLEEGEEEEEDDGFIDPFKRISVIQRRILKKTESFYASELRFRSIDVCTLGSQAVVGDIESILDLNKHISTAVCIEETSYYEMDLSSFVRFIFIPLFLFFSLLISRKHSEHCS